MKYDCSKTMDFVHEAKRMCGSETGCGHCSFLRVGTSSECPFDTIPVKTQEFKQDNIDALQKWSDEHPEKTYLDVVRERFPNCKADKVIDGLCPGTLFSSFDGCKKEIWESSPCKKCWNRPYKGEQ